MPTQLSLAAVLLLFAPPRIHAQVANTFAPAMTCESLKTASPADARITDVVAVTPSATGVPHCKVSGVVGKEINFVALLPTAWNGRFLMGGGGGLVGSVDNQAAAEVNNGYATAGTDTGHLGTPLQGGWALGHEERRINFGSLAVHRTTETVKALIQVYYGKAPVKSYFLGCSNGGRQAMMETQRYPEDFDGVVAGAPAYDFTEVATSFIRNAKALYPDPSQLTPSLLPASVMKVIEAKVLAACDAKDGVTDGVLEDPGACNFKLAAIPPCPDGKAGADCLTKAQRAAVAVIYGPVTDKDGVIYPGQPYGGEGQAAGWPAWITGAGVLMPVSGSTKAPTVQWAFGTEIFKYLVFGDSTWNYARYDLSKARADLANAATYYNAVNVDLSPFAARGGKLIIWHGWSDPALNALASIRYFQKARARSKAVAANLRLFMLPGVLHCVGGTGPDRADWPRVIADWVEGGKAPGRVIASKMGADSKPTRTRPLCPYPEVAAWTGTGSTDREENFACKASRRR